MSTDVALQGRPGRLAPAPQRGPFLVLALLLATVLAALGAAWLPAWIMDYPAAWTLPVQGWVTRFLDWLMRDLDFGLFTFRELTRGFAWLISQPMLFIRGLLASGFTWYLEGGGTFRISPLSWVSIIGAFALFAYYIKGNLFAALVAAAFFYMALFGLWESAMMTLASVIVAVPVGVTIGTLLGIWCFRSPRVEKTLMPVFDVMQTMPSFAYLVPALMMFGYGPVAALVVTMVYAMPPMARATVVGLRGVPQEIVEFGRMVGCSGFQMLAKVMMPAARKTLMVGVNQVIMMSLNVVIIASMIGAGGLGFEVWQALQKLSIGAGLEAGLAITLMAIVLDRLSQEYVARRPAHAPVRGGAVYRWRWPLALAAVLILPTAAGLVLPFLESYPRGWQISTGAFWDGVVSWINVNLYAFTDTVKTWTILNILRPVKEGLLALPWLGVVATLWVLGFMIGGLRLAFLVLGLAMFVAVVGFWDRAMVSLFLVAICVALACLIGIPIGLLSAQHEGLSRVVRVCVETIQTLPTFVYLIPVVMLFGVGDFAGLITITAYALAPAIIYANLGMRLVRPELIEAARTSGCTRFQILRKVQLPLALPQLMLGVNQVIMMALSMLVIASLVGTRGLEQEILLSLSRVNAGQGLVAGLCIACIAIISDRMLGALADKRRKLLWRMN